LVFISLLISEDTFGKTLEKLEFTNFLLRQQAPQTNGKPFIQHINQLTKSLMLQVRKRRASAYIISQVIVKKVQLFL